MRVLTVFPAHNEEATIAGLVRVAKRYGDVLVADDGSTDSTKWSAMSAGARVVSVPPGRRGVVGVYRHGLLEAAGMGADWVFEVDAGGSHDPAQVERFLPSLRTGEWDVVFGRRFGPGASYAGAPLRRWLSLGGTWMANARYGMAMRDGTSGFIAYRADVLGLTHGPEFAASGHYYQTELRARVQRAGLRYCEVPIDFRSTSSSLKAGAVWEAVKLVLRGV